MRLEQHPVTLLYLETLEINCIPFRVITLGPFLSTQQDVGAHLSQITTEVAVCFSVSLCVVAAESYEMLIKNKKLIMFLIDMILFIVCSSFENQLLKVLTVKIQCRDFFFVHHSADAKNSTSTDAGCYLGLICRPRAHVPAPDCIITDDLQGVDMSSLMGQSARPRCYTLNSHHSF